MTRLGWAVLAVLLLALAVGGCAALAAGPPPTPEQECERSRGAWRGNRCESSAGGGGY
jgi:hypothetical protein